MPNRLFHTPDGLTQALNAHQSPTGRPRAVILEVFVKDDINGFLALTTDRQEMRRIVQRTRAVYRVRKL